MDFQSYWRQTRALVQKNFTIILRSWISTPLRVLILPILLTALLLSIPKFAKDQNTYGVASPAPVKSLADSMSGTSKKLAIIESPGLGPDFPAVLEKIIGPLKDKVLRLNSEDKISEACSVDFFGRSECHAILIFNDSPLSGRVNATWNYTIKADPNHSNYPYNVFDRDNDEEGFYMPIQVAVENAMANTRVIPETFTYAREYRQYAQEKKSFFLITTLGILSIAFFAAVAAVSQHVSSMIINERESGMASLMDAMSGGISLVRIASYAITFDILYLPLWIILGCLIGKLLIPTANPAIPLFWQILVGWAVTNASIFGASFFKRSNISSIAVYGISLILAVVAIFTDNRKDPFSIGVVAVLSLLFPPMNYVYFFNCMVKWELTGQPMDLASPIPNSDLDSNLPGQSGSANWVNQSGAIFLWILLIIQIIGYPLLAVLVEKYLHGNNRRRRGFNTTPESQNSNVAIETSDLQKHYTPSSWKRMFCCARKPTVKAVDGLSLVSQKQQILCLLGPNGSGKTTTLDMIAGFHAPTTGSININALPSQIGVCPQKNVFWDKLTVFEHLVAWNNIKGGADSPEALEALIEKCDLKQKRSNIVRNLSGGMKRKLQLACMLVGGSSVCLMDEVTSGLDPLSRRAIWNAILGERARRTMVFTTHFLDECEVLSDNIAILSLGKLKCQGSPAELKNQYGGGYRVHLPKTEDTSHIGYSITDHGDRYICTTPDCSSAAKLLSTLRDSKDSEMFITGPTVEDVFLNVSDEPHAPDEGMNTSVVAQLGGHQQNEPEIATARTAIFLRQFRALLVKRFIVLRSQWWFYLIAIAVPVLATHFIGDFLKDYEAPSCNGLIDTANPTAHTARVYGRMVVGPPEIGPSVSDLQDIDTSYRYGSGYDPSPILEPNREAWLQYFHKNLGNSSYFVGGVFVDNATAPITAIPAGNPAATAIALMNMANQVRTNVPITARVAFINSLNSYASGSTIIWVTIFCILQGLYPAFFSLYPTYEKKSQVRALQYSNGIQGTPLWLSHIVFDLIWVFVVSILCTLLIGSQVGFWGLGHMFVVLVLYGIAATLVAYIISIFSRSQPAAFSIANFVMMAEYVLSLVAINLLPSSDLAFQDGITYGLGLIFPIENVMRAAALGFNQYIVRCRGHEEITDAGSIYAYGGPILLLIIQIVAFFSLLLRLDGAVLSFSKAKAVERDEEKSIQSGRPDIDAETARVVNSEEDLLRLVHVSKKFGDTTAVDDVSLGLRKGEILALLGPNGAGKTTSIDMIRGHLHPTQGSIFLKGVGVQNSKRAAQKHLGVCPQFDALDMMTVREHLTFYARCKGVVDIKADVEYVMFNVGIAAQAEKLAAKLSGGNKRKLSLAISLLGNPPVLLLDEPSSAMDAVSKRVLWKTLEAVAPGRSVLLTTHSMEEADALATRAAIIATRLLAIGTTQKLRKAHSNEYHVQLMLKSAPISTPAEMQATANWVVNTFPNVQFEGQNLGGQVRFIVPADSEVPTTEVVSAVSGSEDSDITQAVMEDSSKSFVRYLIETLEEKKEQLGLECYSIGAATMERVFLSVVKESDAVEFEEKKKPWWRFH